MAAHTLIPDIVHDVPVTDEMIQYAEVYRAIVALTPNPLPHVTYAQAERIAMLEAQNKSQAALMGDLMRENGALLAQKISLEKRNEDLTLALAAANLRAHGTHATGFTAANAPPAQDRKPAHDPFQDFATDRRRMGS
jgi:hypothetical protein